MKKITTVLTLGTFFLFSIGANAQLGKLKDKLAGGGGSSEKTEKSSGGSGKQYKFEDPSGLSGTYYTSEQIVDRQNTIGWLFTKEKEGKIINNLYVELGGKGYGDRPNSVQFTLKEKYKTKYGFNYFYLTDKDCPGLVNNNHKFVFMEIAENTYAFAEEDKVICVAMKDVADFSTYDKETAQVLYDQNMAKANEEAMAKVTEEWMANEVYAKNVKKVVFSNEWYNLQKQGYANKIGVDGKNFKTELDMKGNMNFMAFFENPPSVKYPGQQINIEYEMNGVKANREELRKSSAAWSNMVPILESKDFNYHQSSVRAIREYNQYQSAFSQDYAAIKVIYDNRSKLKVDQTYSFTIRFYTHKDGENGDLIAEGVVTLKYTKEAKIVFEGDPAKPTEKGVFKHFEAFLEE